MIRPSLFTALVVSLGLHGAAGVWVKVRPLPRAANVEPRDVWAGGGIDIEASPPVEPDTNGEIAPAPAPAPEDTTAERGTKVSRSDDDVVCRNDCAPAERDEIPVTKAPDAPRTLPAPASSSARESPTLPASASTALAAPAPSTDAERGTGDAGTLAATAAAAPFGAAGLPPGVRYLPKAYTKALSQGSFKVAAFRTAPAGKLCEARIALEVDAESRLGDVDYESEAARAALPAACRTMFENARRLLHTGGFSIDPKTLGSGTMRLSIVVEITDRAPSDYGDTEMHGESYEPPAPGKRGRSTFVLNSGRRVDAWVELE